VTVDFYCLDCGEPLCVEMKDGAVLNAEADAYMAYVSVPFWKWFENIPYA
jgi:hypothetical protein